MKLNHRRANIKFIASDVAIRVEGLSKLYHIGARARRHDTLRDTLAEIATAPVRCWRERDGHPNSDSDRENTIWALKDISLEIAPGEVVGIIGRNGAGKTTFLKLLSRITEPTDGYAEIHGRIGTLLEVGTGFHPELTGRENIYLSGAILGMRRVEINRKFDEIVAFAEVEKFIDTPVKRYSSGMYVRLAFAVAAYLEPEILLVDEVLAVGDAAFQKKCLGKMGDVAKQGRTVLFVSHNMGQIRNLCQRGLWFHQGKLMQSGSIANVVAAYQSSIAKLIEQSSNGTFEEKYSGFLSWRIVNLNVEDDPHSLLSERPFTIETVLRLTTPVAHAHHGLVLESPEGVKIAGWGLYGLALEPGTYRFSYHFPSLPLRPGAYYWYASLWDGARRVDVAHLLPELIVATEDHSGLSPEWAGILNVPCEIDIQPFRETTSMAEHVSR